MATGTTKRWTVQTKGGKYISIREVELKNPEHKGKSIKLNYLAYTDEPVLLRHTDFSTIALFLANALKAKNAMPIGNEIQLTYRRVK